MPIIELSSKCRQAGIDGDLLAPKNEGQQRSYARAKQAYDDVLNMRQPPAYLVEAAFVLRTAHNADVDNRRYVTYRVLPNPILLPKTGIANQGYNRLIIVGEVNAEVPTLLWPDYIRRSDYHAALCCLVSANAIIHHLMVRGKGHHDTVLMDDAEDDRYRLFNTIKRNQRIERQEAVKRRRQKQ